MPLVLVSAFLDRGAKKIDPVPQAPGKAIDPREKRSVTDVHALQTPETVRQHVVRKQKLSEIAAL